MVCYTFAKSAASPRKVLGLMRSVHGNALVYLVLLSGCGASTGLPLDSSEAAGDFGNFSSESGGSAFGGAYGESGGLAAGAVGGTYDFRYPTGGYTYAYATGTGGFRATGGGKAYPFGGAISNTGGSYYYTGGAKATGGTIYTYTGGTKSTGGAKAYTGGASYIVTGGAKSTGGAFATGGTTALGSMTVQPDGFASINAGLYTLHGYIYSFIGGSSSSLTLSYSTYSSFCAKGTVAANPTYISYAGAGFNVNQTTISSGGVADPLVINAKIMIVSFTNQGSSQLRVQLNDTANDNWCYDITNATSPVTLPLTSFNTHCWDNSGVFFTPGTPINTIQLVVPGDSVVDRPYSFCLLGIVVE